MDHNIEEKKSKCNTLCKQLLMVPAYLKEERVQQEM